MKGTAYNRDKYNSFCCKQLNNKNETEMKIMNSLH